MTHEDAGHLRGHSMGNFIQPSYITASSRDQGVCVFAWLRVPAGTDALRFLDISRARSAATHTRMPGQLMLLVLVQPLLLHTFFHYSLLQQQFVPAKWALTQQQILQKIIRTPKIMPWRREGMVFVKQSIDIADVLRGYVFTRHGVSVCGDVQHMMQQLLPIIAVLSVVWLFKAH